MGFSMGTLAPPLSVSCSFVIHSVGSIQSLEGIFIALVIHSFNPRRQAVWRHLYGSSIVVAI